MRLSGYGYPTSFFQQIKIKGQEYFVPNDKFGYRFFPPALARTPAPQRMAVRKPAHTYRIFVFGESAAMGDPDPSYGVWRYLQTLLRERFPGTDFEVVCVAMTAINSHAILPMTRECARRDGDLWVIYMGNNEMVGPFGAGTVFGSPAPGTGLVRADLAVKTARIGQLLEALMQRWDIHTSTPKMWGGLNMFENHQLRHDDPNRLRAYENFRKNLADILQAGHEAGVPIILSTVGSNLKDCAPFASLHATKLSETQKTKWDEAYQGGIALESAGNYQEALKQYAEAVSIDSEYAELHFRLGSCHLALTNSAQALLEFELGRDYDTLAFRADTRINHIIKDAADAYAGKGVYFLDADRMLAQNSPGKIPGNELFYEHVHLNFEGNYLLGCALAEQTANLLPKSIAAQGNKGWASYEICNRRLAVSPWDRSRVWQEILSRVSEPLYNEQLTHAATVKLGEEKIEQLNSEIDSEAPEKTRQIYQQALALAPMDSFLHQNFAQFLGARGDLVQATIEAQHVCELLPYRPAQYYDIGNLLIIQGRIGEAAENFSRALAIQGDFVHALNGLGQILANQQKTMEAVAYFRHALRVNPEDPETYLNLGFLQQNQSDNAAALTSYQQAASLEPEGPADYFYRANIAASRFQWDEAIADLSGVVKARPEFWQARYQLGVQLAAKGETDDAETQFSAVIYYRPDFLPAHLDRGTGLATQGKLDPALAEFRAVLQLDPANTSARQQMAAIESKLHPDH